MQIVNRTKLSNSEWHSSGFILFLLQSVSIIDERCRKMVPRKMALEKYFIIKLGNWFLVSKGRTYGAIILYSLRLKYSVFIEKMASKDDTLLESREFPIPIRG